MNTIDSKNSIYGEYLGSLEYVIDSLKKRLELYDKAVLEKTGEKSFEHLRARIKSDESMREKLDRRGLPQTSLAAMKSLTDSIGLRIVCSFRDDIYKMVDFIKTMPDVTIIKEKDYIKHAKPNGYRSYHLILEVEAPMPDVTGALPGKFFVEVL